MKRDILTVKDLSAKEILDMIDRALALIGDTGESAALLQEWFGS